MDKRVEIRCPRCAAKVTITVRIEPVLSYTYSPKQGFLTANAGTTGTTHVCDGEED